MPGFLLYKALILNSIIYNFYVQFLDMNCKISVVTCFQERFKQWNSIYFGRCERSRNYQSRIRNKIIRASLNQPVEVSQPKIEIFSSSALLIYKKKQNGATTFCFFIHPSFQQISGHFFLILGFD